MPAPYQNYLPLLDAKNATLVVDADQRLRIIIRLAFADEEHARKGEQAAREAVVFASLVMRQFPVQWEKIPDPALKPLLPKFRGLMEEIATAFVANQPQRRSLVVEHTIRIQSPDWFDTVVQAAPFLAPRPVKPGTTSASSSPVPRNVESPKTPGEAEAAIKKLGGNVTHEGNDEKKPIVEITVRKKLSDDDLRLIGSLTAVRRLWVLDCGITDNGLRNLTGLVNLEELELGGNRITDEGVKCLVGLGKLKHLSLTGNRITDASLERLKNLKQLESLKVSGNDLTDEGIAHLKGLSTLKSLSLLGSVRITDKGMGHLTVLKNLTKLDVGGCSVTGDGLAHLNDLTNLEELSLSNNRIRNKDLAHLKSLKKLAKLNLSDNFGISDQGLDALKELGGLTELRLISTSITKKGAEELKKALLKTEIIHQ